MDMLKASSLTILVHWLALFTIPCFASEIHAGTGDDNAPQPQGKRYPELTVLAYVTPWNSRGKELAEKFRDKLDIVSPVWYTVHADGQEPSLYTVRGGPPAPEDEEWHKRLQTPSSSGGAKAVQMMPRFILDNWAQDDYRNFIFNETRWQMLADAILEPVIEMSYDGIVFESGATHAMAQPLSILSESLHAKDKKLVLVSPPVRTPASLGRKGQNAAAFKNQNAMLLQSVAVLGPIADYLSIMTYDMTGPGGRDSTTLFPADTVIGAAQAEGGVREPGPNTSAQWVRENLMAFMQASDPALARLEPSNQQQLNLEPQNSAKFLMGLPMYGYTYPILYVDRATGALAHAGYSEETVAIIKGAPSAITAIEIARLIDEHIPEVLQTDEGEFFFDYEDQDGAPCRVFIPHQKSMAKTLEEIRGVMQHEHTAFGGAGVALWDLGQSSDELLAQL